MCEESGEVDVDKMREDISTAFMGFDFDWKSALLTCSAVKFPMLCSLTERVQEDLDSKSQTRFLALLEFSLSNVHRRCPLSTEIRFGFTYCSQFCQIPICPSRIRQTV